MNKKQNQKRYNLHYKLRKKGFKLETKAKTIFIPVSLTELPKQVKRLKDEFNYCIQLTLLTH